MPIPRPRRRDRPRRPLGHVQGRRPGRWREGRDPGRSPELFFVLRRARPGLCRWPHLHQLGRFLLSDLGRVRHPSISPVPLPTVPGFSTFRSVTNAGSFEGQTTYGLGVRARLPFRVFTIAGGHGRIVVDVAHHWTA